jgi:uncharacterized protein YciI/GNAT superfamily N-acetyltransferase
MIAKCEAIYWVHIKNISITTLQKITATMSIVATSRLRLPKIQFLIQLAVCLSLLLQPSRSLIASHLPVRSCSSSSRSRNTLGLVVASTSATTSSGEDSVLSRISYRSPTVDDIPALFAIESASYPTDEAASLESLTLRLTSALPYFQCAVLSEDDYDTDNDTIIGFCCSTRCDEFEEESMSTHAPNGSLLAIHSVVVQEDYRRGGVATAMLKHYLETIRNRNARVGGSSTAANSIQSIVLLAKANLLGFYVNCGFQVNRPSPIVHGQELWYDLEQKLVRSHPLPEESWFCKTERFQRPFPEVRPHLEAHKAWVLELRRQGHCVTSGYRVDADGKPGGGGLMFLAAKSYQDALDIVLQDPLVANDCVDWELNGWIGQVGDVQMR